MMLVCISAGENGVTSWIVIRFILRFHITEQTLPTCFSSRWPLDLVKHLMSCNLHDTFMRQITFIMAIVFTTCLFWFSGNGFKKDVVTSNRLPSSGRKLKRSHWQSLLVFQCLVSGVAVFSYQNSSGSLSE